MEHWEHLQEEGKAAWRANNIPRAVELFSQSVDESEDAVSGAAMFFHFIKDFNEAVPLIRREVARVLDECGPCREVASLMCWLAGALREAGEVAEADQVEKESIAMWPDIEVAFRGLDDVSDAATPRESD